MQDLSNSFSTPTLLASWMSEEYEESREEEDEELLLERREEGGERERECPVVGQCEWNYAPFSLRSSLFPQ